MKNRIKTTAPMHIRLNEPLEEQLGYFCKAMQMNKGQAIRAIMRKYFEIASDGFMKRLTPETDQTTFFYYPL